MRNIVYEDNYIFQKVYNQLAEMDFYNFYCSPLINGGCGMGKTSALYEPEMYKLFKTKLHKTAPQILIIESRSATRDQGINKNTNPNIHIEQFDVASREKLENFDIIIIDEAHSLFSDSEFASRVTTPLADWLRKSLCFQIYITASDTEFISYASKYFTHKEFCLTFPDLTEVHARYMVEKMYLSLTTDSVKSIIARKERHFFQDYKKGLFFVFSAKEAVDLYNHYSELGYKCGFYVSQQNESQLIKKEAADEEDPEYFDAYASREIKIDVLDYYHVIEHQRALAGKESIRQSLINGHFPQDIDYLFITSVGQEGISLFDMQMDFVFIEDTYPLTINQKIFRYRNNVQEVYLHLPQRRIQQALEYTLKKLDELYHADQQFLKGYYEGAGGKRRTGLAKAIWLDPADNKYKVSESYMAFILTKSEFYCELRENKDNYDWMRDNYGQYAKVFELVSAKADKRKDILTNFMSDKDGVVLTDEMKKSWTEELKNIGLTNEKEEKDFTFSYIMKLCKEFQICDFKRHKASKQDIKNNPDLSYRKEYVQIVVLS